MSAPNLKGAEFWSRPGLHAVLDVLNREGEEARVVGGAVRNALMGVPVVDVDIATTALPQEVMRRVKAAGLKAVPTGIAHGTVTVVAEHTPYEVTTLREDTETNGRHAVVTFGRNWAEDAARRDFTINALYATRDGVVIDLVGGLEDIAARRVRFIGDADARIREDYLRILRLFRFHAGYGEGAMDAVALAACVRQRAGLAPLSRERVGAEMRKLLLARGAVETFRVMSDSGLLQPLLAGIGDVPVLGRLERLEQEWGVPGEAMRHLAALALRVPGDVPRLRTRLRLSNDETRRLAAMAGSLPQLADAACGGELLYRLGPETVRDLALLEAARSTTGQGRKADLHELVQQAGGWQRPRLPITAQHLIAHGLKPGPQLGEALRRAESRWIEAGFPDAPERLAQIVEDAIAP